MEKKGFKAYWSFDQFPIMKIVKEKAGLCYGLATMFLIYEAGLGLIMQQANGNHRSEKKDLPKFIQVIIEDYHRSQHEGGKEYLNCFKALECKFSFNYTDAKGIHQTIHDDSERTLEFKGFRHFCNTDDCYDDLGKFLTTPIKETFAVPSAPPSEQPTKKELSRKFGWFQKSKKVKKSDIHFALKSCVWRKVKKTYFLINIPGHTMSAYYLNGILLLFDPNVGLLGINRPEEAGNFLRSYFQSRYQHPNYRDSVWNSNDPKIDTRPTFVVIRFFPRDENDASTCADDGREFGTIPNDYGSFMKKLLDSQRCCCKGSTCTHKDEACGGETDDDEDDVKLDLRHPLTQVLSNLTDEEKQRRAKSQRSCWNLFQKNWTKAELARSPVTASSLLSGSF